MNLLTDYADYMNKYADMMEKFCEVNFYHRKIVDGLPPGKNICQCDSPFLLLDFP